MPLQIVRVQKHIVEHHEVFCLRVRVQPAFDLPFPPCRALGCFAQDLQAMGAEEAADQTADPVAFGRIFRPVLPPGGGEHDLCPRGLHDFLEQRHRHRIDDHPLPAHAGQVFCGVQHPVEVQKDHLHAVPSVHLANIGNFSSSSRCPASRSPA